MQTFVFPGGEPHIILSDEDIAACNDIVVLIKHCRSPNDWMCLLVTLDAIFRYAKYVHLKVPYFPGARQDRYDDKQPGTPHTLKVYGTCLKQFPLLATIVYDIHNPVEAAKWIPNLVNIELHELLPPLRQYSGVIRPDKGAEDRAVNYANKNGFPVFRATKIRNAASGQLSDFECESLPDPKGHYVIVDDIADGCGTFIGLAKAIKRASPDVKLDLKVTHGIFSKGLEEVLNLFEVVHTTDSFVDPKLADKYPKRLVVEDTHHIGIEL